jgi:hypothetical protein
LTTLLSVTPAMPSGLGIMAIQCHSWQHQWQKMSAFLYHPISCSDMSDVSHLYFLIIWLSILLT